MPLRVSRPALRYYGGGWMRASWTVNHFPQHASYLEPCFGAGSILFHKRPCKLETVNDKDGRVVNFFRMLRERPCELINAIHLTPWAEAEYRQALHMAENDALEDARRFFFTCWASIQGGPASGPSDFRFQKKLTRRSAAVKDVADLGHLREAARRLKNVQILQRDGLDVIDAHHGRKCLIYFDPPYLPSTRHRRDGYRHEPEVSWHRDAAELLRRHRGPVIVAGYRSALYAELYETRGWNRVEREQATNSGGRGVECLWLSPATVDELGGRESAGPLFQ